MNAEQELSALRQTICEHNLDAWIIPFADPHLSEHLPEHWQARVYSPGFIGSIGTLAITADKTDLWADSRYWGQAAHQLQGGGIGLQEADEVAPYTDWLTAELPDGTSTDMATNILLLAAKRQSEIVFAVKNIRLDVSRDIADTVWTSRPALPQETVFPHDMAFASETAAARLAHVCAAVKGQDTVWYLISLFDDTTWLTNLRGSDVPYNPMFPSYLFIGTDSAILSVDKVELNPVLRALLAEAGITTAPYTAVCKVLGKISDGLLVSLDKTAVSTL